MQTKDSKNYEERGESLMNSIDLHGTKKVIMKRFFLKGVGHHALSFNITNENGDITILNLYSDEEIVLRDKFKVGGKW